jgi:CheY-like chemotaxis protein
MSDDHLPPRRVLVVDDEPDVREVVTIALRRLGFSVVEAADGPTALAQVRAGTSFDLIILDLVLPGPSGQQVFREIRRTTSAPVLFHSGFRGTEKLTEELAAPETGFIQKPWSLDGFKKAVFALLRPQ